MKKLLCVVVLISLAACRTVPPPVSFQKTTFPLVGTVATAGIGEHLLMQVEGATVAAIVIPQDQVIGDFLVRKGKYPQTEQKSEYIGFGNVEISTATGAPVKNNKLYLFAKNTDKTVCISRTICAVIEYTLDKNTIYEKARSPHSQKTLLYSGRVGNRITLGYREFSNDLARPAFNNDVAYDLSESSILGYKGARLEVIKATNTDITYKVIAGFE